MDTTHSHSHLVPWAIAGAAVLYGIYTTYRLCKGGCSKKEGRCNNQIRLGEQKVVHSFDIESLGDKNVYCRCWSKKFPYCDGSHNAHNEQTKDNVGPLIIKKKDA